MVKVGSNSKSFISQQRHYNSHNLFLLVATCSCFGIAISICGNTSIVNRIGEINFFSNSSSSFSQQTSCKWTFNFASDRFVLLLYVDYIAGDKNDFVIRMPDGEHIILLNMT